MLKTVSWIDTMYDPLLRSLTVSYEKMALHDRQDELHAK